MSTPLAIPAELMARLEQIRPQLETNCAIQCRREPDRQPVWRLRYWDDPEDGERRQRSLNLGEETIANAVRALVAGWRDERERKQAAEEQCVEERRRRLERLRQLAISRGRGKRHRRRIGRAFDRAAAGGDRALLRFAMMASYEQRPSRGGRPRTRSGLW